MLSLPRNPTSHRAWSPVPSPQPSLGIQARSVWEAENLLPEGSQAGKRARVLEGCTQFSGFGKVTLRGDGDFGLNEIVDPGRTLEGGEKHAPRSPPQLLTLRQPCRSLGRVNTLWVYLSFGFLQVICGLPNFRFLPRIFPVSHPAVYHLYSVFPSFFFFCRLTHFSLNKCIQKGDLITLL